MPIRPETDEAIAFLNSLVAIDRHFVQELMALRVPCNSQIANHPSVQVGIGSDKDVFVRPNEYRCGILGVLNGFFGTFDGGDYAGWGPIAAVYSSEGLLTKFIRTDSGEFKSIKSQNRKTDADKLPT
jgi:hypothetical protein